LRSANPEPPGRAHGSGHHAAGGEAHAVARPYPGEGLRIGRLHHLEGGAQRVGANAPRPVTAMVANDTRRGMPRLSPRWIGAA
jgi:hypothetical protein